MGGEGERATAPGAGTRSVVYCVISSELASKLHDLLRRHFADDPGVEVVVERRGRERRGGAERRQGVGDAPTAGERRQIRAAAGRRVGERRASLVPASPPALPRRARRYEDQIAFVERLEPSTEEAEDQDTARLVARVQAGESEAFATLYTRYFDRVYSYMRVVLRDRDEAEDAAQQVFTQLFEAMPRYERRAQPFRAWMFVAARNYALQYLRKHSRVELRDPSEIDRTREAEAVEEPDADLVQWLTDRDLVVLVERLPVAQRQTLTMRYMLGFSNAEIARVLGRSPESVRMLQSRALAFLRQRLTALGRAPEKGDRARMQRWPRQARVLRARRFSLLGPGPTR